MATGLHKRQAVENPEHLMAVRYFPARKQFDLGFRVGLLYDEPRMFPIDNNVVKVDDNLGGVYMLSGRAQKMVERGDVKNWRNYRLDVRVQVVKPVDGRPRDNIFTCPCRSLSEDFEDQPDDHGSDWPFDEALEAAARRRRAKRRAKNRTARLRRRKLARAAKRAAKQAAKVKS